MTCTLSIGGGAPTALQMNRATFRARLRRTSPVARTVMMLSMSAHLWLYQRQVVSRVLLLTLVRIQVRSEMSRGCLFTRCLLPICFRFFEPNGANRCYCCGRGIGNFKHCVDHHSVCNLLRKLQKAKGRKRTSGEKSDFVQCNA